MGKWKYFTQKEVEGVHDAVVDALDKAREFYGFPIEITCGYRSPEHNAAIGGVPNSAHTLGLAVDIKAPQDPFMRTKLAWALGSAGFRRLEVAEKHYHVDFDQTKPWPAVWEGPDL